MRYLLLLLLCSACSPLAPAAPGVIMDVEIVDAVTNTPIPHAAYRVNALDLTIDAHGHGQFTGQLGEAVHVVVGAPGYETLIEDGILSASGTCVHRLVPSLRMDPPTSPDPPIKRE